MELERGVDELKAADFQQLLPAAGEKNFSNVSRIVDLPAQRHATHKDFQQAREKDLLICEAQRGAEADFREKQPSPPKDA